MLNPKPLLSLISFFSTDSSVSLSSSYAVRQLWERRKRYTRALTAIWFVVVIVIGLEIGTPNYSLSGEIGAVFSSNSEIMTDIVEGSTGTNPDSTVSGKEIKYFFIIFFSLIVFVATAILDPFSDFKRLSVYNKKKHSKLLSWTSPIKDLKRYAEILPSNNLASLCKDCTSEKACGNSITCDDYSSIRHWGRLLSSLEVSEINKHLKLLSHCRSFYFFKNSLFYLVPILLLTYAALRLFEGFHPDVKITLNAPLLTYIAGLLLLYIGLEAVDRHGRSFLGKLEINIQTIMNSDTFKEEFEKIYCENNAKTRIDIIEDVAQCIKNYFSKRMQIITDKKDSHTHTPRDMVLQLLEVIVDIFYKLYDDRSDLSIRACVFLPALDEMKPWASYDKNAEMLEEYRHGDQFFSINFGNSVASKAWRDDKIMSVDRNIPTYYDGQEDKIRSILAHPIKIQNPFMESVLDDEEPPGEKIHAVLCLDANSKDIFTAATHEFNVTVLSAFLPFLKFEVAYPHACMRN